MTYCFNPQAQLRWLRLGQDAVPALCIDDALLDLAPLRQAAARAVFSADAGSFYPGVRAPLPTDYARCVLEALYPLLLQLAEPPPAYRLQPLQWDFSLLTTPAAELAPLQRLPHFDKPEPYHLAILHYLADGAHGGTGFFRHRSSGLERIGVAQQSAYFAALQQELSACGGLPAAYPAAELAFFELYQQVEYRPNRLLVYPGQLLHSALVSPALDLSAEPLTGRLTANLFVQFQPPPPGGSTSA